MVKQYYIKSPDIIIKGIGNHSVWIYKSAIQDAFEHKTSILLCGYSSIESFLQNPSNFLASDGCTVDTTNMEVQAGILDPQLLQICLEKMPQFKNSTLELYEKN